MSDNPWDSLQRELNARQREAVFTQSPHCLVLAGPGTGKTRTLINRIVYLVKVAAVEPAAILALTFTRKAASVMTERLAGYLGKQAGEIHAGTFHHIGLHLLRANAGREGIPRDFSVADEPRQVRTLERAWHRLDFSSRSPEGKELRMLLGRFADYRLDPAASDLSALQRDLFAEYQRLLRDESAIDFDDILDLTRKLLESDAELLQATRARWSHVLVDEFQDTDTQQYRILRLLAPEEGCSFLVADDQQSIYAWRGADRRNLDSYRRDYDAEEICLEENYRNSEKILAGASAVLEGGGQGPRDLVSRTGVRGFLRLEAFPNEANEADFLAADIRRSKLRERLRWRDIAILYPKHSIGEFLETRLMGERVPVELVAGRALLEQTRIRQLLAYLRILRNGSDEEALETLLGAHLDEGSRALFRRCSRRRGDSIRSTLDYLIRSRGRLQGLRRAWEGFSRKSLALDNEAWLAAWGDRFPDGLGVTAWLGEPDSNTDGGDAPGGKPCEQDADSLRRTREDEGEILQHLSRLPWLLESLVARISNLRAGSDGRTLSQLVREILLELKTHEGETIPGDPADCDGLEPLLQRVRQLLRQGHRVQLRAGTPDQAQVLADMLALGLEPWLAQGIYVGDDAGRLPALVLDTAAGELRLEDDVPLRVPAESGALSTFRLFQMWRAADHRGLSDFVIFDLETTGLDVATCDVIEIAAIRYENGREVDRFETFVRPSAPIPPSSTAVHGITDAMTADAPLPVQAMVEFLNFVGDRDLVAHNGAGYDFPIIRRLARENHLRRPVNALYDTLALARRLFPGERVRLEDLINRFGISAEARHRALDDCRCLAEAFVAMQKLHLGQLRRQSGYEALAPLALAWYLDPQGPPRKGAGVPFTIFRQGVRRLLASGSRWLERYDDPERRQELEAGLVEAAGLEREAPDLFSGMHSEEERFLALVPRFDELFLGDSLAGFLDFLALYQAPDLVGGQDAVQLMTIHSAKGLEFRRVYIVGLEENVLPGFYALRADDPAAVEEERRLLYVAMTRAAESLTLTRVESRGGFRQEPSRFLADLTEGKDGV
ncbi:MAG: UvrD-helicase domain-containing protein [bacterium]|nr:UvrD-helicase domain-containing protein [bacterium]